MRYTTVLFDADNTLFDFSRAERAALDDALTAFGVTPDEDKARHYSAVNDMMWKKLERGEISKSALRVARFEVFCRDYGLDVDVPALAVAYTDHLAEKAFLLPGALETCRILSAFFNLYLITNGLKTVQEKRFAASPLTPYFRGAFISEVMGAEKPDLAYFAAVARAIKRFDPDETLVVGDSLTSDMAGGIAAGLDTCWFNPRHLDGKGVPVTYTVDRLEDVIPLVTA